MNASTGQLARQGAESLRQRGFNQHADAIERQADLTDRRSAALIAVAEITDGTLGSKHADRQYALEAIQALVNEALS